ncbi:MAG: DUF2330 domain-containing protein [Candidatus Bathyarchaeia archaeon]
MGAVERGIAIAVLLCLMASLPQAPLAQSDRGVLPIGDASVHGPGQRAIIAWNGAVERLILSTDLYASAETRALEVLPLPSKPSVEGGSFQSFEAVQRLIMRHSPRSMPPKYLGELEIIFHERIGAHDITVLRAGSVEELIAFLTGYAKGAGIEPPSLGGETRRILSGYLARGFIYWVLDLIDLHPSPRSIEPIAYEFASASLYYPLMISSIANGATEITLYLITRGRVAEGSLPPKMALARYDPRAKDPIQFQISAGELAEVDARLAELFPRDSPIWLTVVRYKGDASELDFDLEIRPGGTQCRSIRVSPNKALYGLGEAVEITVDYVHLLPGCLEVQALHFHRIRLEILDSTGGIVRSWHWDTNGDLRKAVVWDPDKIGPYSARASSWWNGETMEVEDSARFAVEEARPPTRIRFPWPFVAAGLAASCAAIGALYALLRRKGISSIAPTGDPI